MTRTRHLAASLTTRAADSLCSIISSNTSYTKDTLISNDLQSHQENVWPFWLTHDLEKQKKSVKQETGYTD